MSLTLLVTILSISLPYQTLCQVNQIWIDPFSEDLSSASFIDDYIWEEPDLSNWTICSKVLDEAAGDDDNVHEMDVLSLSQDPGKQVHSSIKGAVENIWADNKVPVMLEAGLTLNEQKKLACAVTFFEEKTCIRFIKATPKHTDYVLIRKTDPRSGCFSEYLGNGGGEQIVNFDMSKVHCWRHGTIVHELMHVVGFFHEQARNDRDKYIKVHSDKIPDRYKRQYQTATELGLTQKLIGDYDYSSVMHYPRYLTYPTALMTAKKEPIEKNNEAMGNRKAPTAQDAHKINLLYSCPGITQQTTSGDMKILLFGGESVLSEIEVYYPDQPENNHVVNVQLGQGRRCHTSAAVTNQTVITVGGLDPNGTFLTDCELYSVEHNTVSQCANDLNTPRAYIASAVIDQNLYICGGYGEGWVALRSCEQYTGSSDNQVGLWHYFPEMNYKRSHLAMVALNREIYTIGGYDNGAVNYVERYSPMLNKWGVMPAMTSKRYGHAAAVLNNQLTICGGATTDGVHITSCEQFIPDQNKWNFIPQMNSNRFMFNLVNVGNRLVALGGITDYITVEMFDKGKWSFVRQMKYARYESSAAVVVAEKEKRMC